MSCIKYLGKHAAAYYNRMWYSILKNGLKLHVAKYYKYTTKPTQTKRCRRQCTDCARKFKSREILCIYLYIKYCILCTYINV